MVTGQLLALRFCQVPPRRSPTHPEIFLSQTISRVLSPKPLTCPSGPNPHMVPSCLHVSPSSFFFLLSPPSPILCNLLEHHSCSKNGTRAKHERALACGSGTGATVDTGKSNTPSCRAHSADSDYDSPHSPARLTPLTSPVGPLQVSTQL